MSRSDEFSEIGGTDTKEGNSEWGFRQFADENKTSIALLLIGLIIIGFGVFLYKAGYIGSSDKVEIIDPKVTVASDTSEREVVVEISGEVQKPGVYKLSEGDRIEDLLIVSGGFSANADRPWAEKFINRAAKLTDGQKIYIPEIGEQSGVGSANNGSGIKLDQGVFGVNTSGVININTATLSELDTLPGIGQVFGQSIIDHRPYSSIEELVSKEAIKQSVYEKIKDKVSVY